MRSSAVMLMTAMAVIGPATLGAGTIQSGADYSIFLGNTTIDGANHAESTPGSIFVESSSFPQLGAYYGAAGGAASFGTLGGFATARSDGTYKVQSVGSGSYSTTVTISGPQDGQSMWIAINLTSDPGSILLSGLNATVDAVLDVGTWDWVARYRSDWQWEDNCLSGFACVPYWPLTGGALNSPPVFEVVAGEPFILGLSVNVQAWASQGTATADFLHTVGFANSGPVFNLPAGYTANSDDGLIVNNGFLGWQATAAPEPATWLTLATALMLIGTGSHLRPIRRWRKSSGR